MFSISAQSECTFGFVLVGAVLLSGASFCSDPVHVQLCPHRSASGPSEQRGSAGNSTAQQGTASWVTLDAQNKAFTPVSFSVCFLFVHFCPVWCDTALPDTEWRRADAELWPRLSTHGWQSMVRLCFMFGLKSYKSLALVTSNSPLFFSSRTELVFSVTRELLSVSPSSLSPPLFTPPNLLSVFSRYVDRQRLELLQDKLQ